MKILKLALLIILCFQINFAKAEHVVGANLSYKMISSTTTDFTIEVTVSYLVECGSGSGNAGFPILVYTHNANNDQYTFNTAFYHEANNTSVLDNIEYECLAVPNTVCTRRIRSTQLVTFPYSEESYVLVHSSCCRNAANINIIAPLENGLTVFEVITPFDQQTLNSSPQFDVTTSLTICSNEFTNYELPLSDPDGDSLAIRLCQLEYMGQDQQHAPPYPSLFFEEGAGFDFENPLGPTGSIEIDETGQFLEILASQQGHFAMAICVEEFRDGVSLGESKLELQIVVLECLNVQANADTDFTDTDGVEVITLCGDNRIQMTNNSFPQSIITSTLWTIENENNTFSWTDWEPTIMLPNGGEFTGTLVVTSIFECPDTLHFKFRSNPNLEIGYEIGDLTCDSEALTIFDQTFSDAAIVDQLYIVNGDSFFTANPIVEFSEDGNYDIQYSLMDEFGCTAFTSGTFFYQPEATAGIIMEDETTSCMGKFFTPDFNMEDFDDWKFEDNPWTAEISVTEPQSVTIIALRDGCEFSKTFFVTPIVCESQVYIPNIFSPNDDGFNDQFGPAGNDFEVLSFVIFDRWGNQVFDTNSNNTYWNGKVKGEFMDPGVYPYRLQYRETLLGNVLVETGTVTLIR